MCGNEKNLKDVIRERLEAELEIYQEIMTDVASEVFEKKIEEKIEEIKEDLSKMIATELIDILDSKISYHVKKHLTELGEFLVKNSN